MNLELFKWSELKVGDLICDRDLTDIWLLIKRTEKEIFLMRLKCFQVFSFEEYETKYWNTTYIALDARPESATITFGETK